MGGVAGVAQRGGLGRWGGVRWWGGQRAVVLRLPRIASTLFCHRACCSAALISG